MTFLTRQIRGRGRGKFLGFPTINMEISKDLKLNQGIYAVWVAIGESKFKGALHFGPVPTFAQSAKSLEVFLLDTTEKQIQGLNTMSIHITPVKLIREVRKFSSPMELVAQMKKDIMDARAAFLAQ